MVKSNARSNLQHVQSAEAILNINHILCAYQSKEEDVHAAIGCARRRVRGEEEVKRCWRKKRVCDA